MAHSNIIMTHRDLFIYISFHLCFIHSVRLPNQLTTINTLWMNCSKWNNRRGQSTVIQKYLLTKKVVYDFNKYRLDCVYSNVYYKTVGSNSICVHFTRVWYFLRYWYPKFEWGGFFSKKRKNNDGKEVWIGMSMS